MSKRIALITALTLISLTGCAPTTPADGPGSLRSYVVDLPDGGKVVCVKAKDFSQTGITCDWEARS
ncbi:hypothetical protein FYJ24_06995 [Actinomycetaceae bacterium WB03_NA08]|uniref:Uncharacterized protein n=1 Tax=Scrofimicrobium canadense TaxID=2652290 RepID=A0A6N7VRV6_9ACTO|nr:hypothetical protein [Scrofimicrobium canadense]MSS84514.1 hypothetical protein [Scrofimicrobium canadense]